MSLICLLSVPVKSLKYQILISKCYHISISFLNRYGTSCYYQFNWNDTRSYDIQGDWFFLPSLTFYDRARKQKRKRYLFSSLPSLFNSYFFRRGFKSTVQQKRERYSSICFLYSSNHQILLAVKVMAELTRTLRTNSFISDYHHSERKLTALLLFWFWSFLDCLNFFVCHFYLFWLTTGNIGWYRTRSFKPIKLRKKTLIGQR